MTPCSNTQTTWFMNQLKSPSHFLPSLPIPLYPPSPFKFTLPCRLSINPYHTSTSFNKTLHSPLLISLQLYIWYIWNFNIDPCKLNLQLNIIFLSISTFHTFFKSIFTATRLISGKLAWYNELDPGTLTEPPHPANYSSWKQKSTNPPRQNQPYQREYLWVLVTIQLKEQLDPNRQETHLAAAP